MNSKKSREGEIKKGRGREREGWRGGRREGGIDGCKSRAEPHI